MSNKSIILVVKEYEKARITFVKDIAQIATGQCSAEDIESSGVLELLKQMLTDVSPSARQYAWTAIARLAERDRRILEKIVHGGSLRIMLDNMNKYDIHYKKSALHMITAVSTYYEQLTSDVVALGALNHLVSSLEEVDPMVKMGAVRALGLIGEHTKELTERVLAAGALPLMVLAYQEPDMIVKKETALAMVRLARHKPEAVFEAGAICHLVQGLDHNDSKLKDLTLSVLSNIAGASGELAEVVVEGGALLPALRDAGHVCPYVRREVAHLLLNIVKHNAELAQMVAIYDGCVQLVALASDTVAGARSTACMALGTISSWYDQLATVVISCKAVPVLVELLQENEIDEETKSAAAWALGQIGKHSHKDTRAVAEAEAFPKLLQLYSLESASPELRKRALDALRLLLARCDHLPALLSIAHAPQEIFKYTVEPYAKILPNDANARLLFERTGALQRMREIDAVPGTPLAQHISIINASFHNTLQRNASLNDVPHASGSGSQEKASKPPAAKRAKLCTGGCPVCFEQFGTTEFCSTKCGHVFCKTCLLRLIESNGACPTCRERLQGPNAYHPLYLDMSWE